MTESHPRPRKLANDVRIVTAAALFDGHDAAINLMRRLLQAAGAEVIHLGHNRSALEIVECAIEEDAQAIALTSYQGGHVETLKYMHDLLEERGAKIKIFGGGGGTILPAEIEVLHAYGIARIYSPDDGRSMGLTGMIDDLLGQADFPVDAAAAEKIDGLDTRSPALLARLITVLEHGGPPAETLQEKLRERVRSATAPVLGITGTGGAGKSSLIDELVRRFLFAFSDKRIAIISVDPSKRRSGGALLGDRIRMGSVKSDRVYMRSLATRQANLALSGSVQAAIDAVRAAGFDLVIVETSGIGQSDTEIVDVCDVSLYVMTAEYGAASQLEKVDMLDFADVIALNKLEKPGSLDALRDVRKQYRRSRNQFELADEALPVVGTIASQFNDPGTNALFVRLMEVLTERAGVDLVPERPLPERKDGARAIIPAAKVRYLAEIADLCEAYDARVEAQATLASQIGQLDGALEQISGAPEGVCAALEEKKARLETQLDGEASKALETFGELEEAYSKDVLRFDVRGRTLEQSLVSTTLSGTRIPKVCLPKYRDPGDRLRWSMRENVPGRFPFTAGVFPLKREGEAPARMFAGEGDAERTNRRFHYLSRGMPAARLSTAFDSVTLYGEDPDERPDIYGKIGTSGVSISTVDDAKKLYSGFDLAAPSTSVSMTINGPAPMILAFYMNAAIDQGCEKYIRAEGLEAEVEAKIAALYEGKPRPRYRGDLPEGNDGLGLMLLGVSGDRVLPEETYRRIRADVMKQVRGTVQADILKEDQAQNTCIFSTELALRMMGDIQESFIAREVRNFYSVSISGYHIAEAGANPISQLAFTLSNGFTFVEYYLSRGMDVDAFAPNLSFFFSNGMDPEYAVMGRVARRIWAKAMRDRYGANERSQKLKYHIQTSGRSLHAQEIGFNDIRTTLQALYALYDNCNSLHTNAYDEAITTPTEESVRRALAIQLIIDQELGLAKNQNPLQGAFIIEELTDLVEAAVLAELRRLSDRGGVLGAMERMYQRSKIQEESLHYETLKHDGRLPVIGVNTFLSEEGSPTVLPKEVIRGTEAEKQGAVADNRAFRANHARRASNALEGLESELMAGGNAFEALLEVTKVATLGQISGALYEVGGQYRRCM